MEELNNFTDSARFSDDDVVMATPRRQAEFLYSGQTTTLRALVWTVCSVASALSGKHLMHHTVFPFTLSFIYVVVLLGVYIVHRVYVANDSTILRAPWKVAEVLRDESTGRNIRPYVALMPAAISYAVAIPLLMQGLLHLPSLPVFLMLFPVTYAIEWVTLSLISSLASSISKSSIRPTQKWEVFSILFFMIILLYNDYRLNLNGISFCIGGVFYLGLFRACISIEAREFLLGEDPHGITVNTDFLMPMMIVVCGIVSGLACFLFELSGSALPVDLPTIAVVIFNISSSIGLIMSGTTPLVFSPIIYGKPFTPQFTDGIISPECRVVVSAIPCLIVYFVTTYTGTIYLSSIQLVAFLASLVALAGTAYIYSINHRFLALLHHKSSISASDLQDSGLKISLFTILCHLIIIILFTGVVQRGALAGLSSVHRGPRPNLDLSFKPRNKFDIIISMYDEDPTLVKETIEAVIDTNYLRSVSPRVTIYTKDPTADHSSIQDATGADFVHKLENRGREGGTYLYHILHNWDSLSEQTMFIQAHVHNKRELIPRIDKFLQHDTGMLSLGFSGVTCDCNSCTDRHGWQDDEQLLPELYSRIYGDGDCENVLLSYKGQFVASARRLRGIPKDIYQGLYDSVVGKSLSNEEPGGDDPSAPVFGFALERLWSLLLQCSDLQVAVKCPTLLSGWRVGGDVTDCQCLDPLEGIR